MRKLSYALGCLTIICIFSCHKDQDSTLPYVGAWQTEVYTYPFDTLGSLINQRMVFVFTAGSFSDTVNHVLGYIEEPIYCTNGTLVRLNDNQLSFRTSKLGEIQGNHIEWITSDSILFDSLYISRIPAFLPSQFEAEYIVQGSSLDLIISGTGDTLKLSAL
jgi:hypothetical protein